MENFETMLQEEENAIQIDISNIIQQENEFLFLEQNDLLDQEADEVRMWDDELEKYELEENSETMQVIYKEDVLQHVYKTEMEEFWVNEKEADYTFQLGILDEIDGISQEVLADDFEELNHVLVQELKEHKNILAQIIEEAETVSKETSRNKFYGNFDLVRKYDIDEEGLNFIDTELDDNMEYFR